MPRGCSLSGSREPLGEARRSGAGGHSAADGSLNLYPLSLLAYCRDGLDFAPFRFAPLRSVETALDHVMRQFDKLLITSDQY